MTNLESALAYARRGYRIFPVKPMGKMPLTSMGFKEASVSEAIIRKWWEEWPEANIGLPVPEGLVVVDVDGDEGRQVLVAEDLSLPSSVWAVTPRGSHHWYSMPEGQEASPKVGLFPGIDIRAYGSYVVAPPSCGADGVLYEWRNDLLSCAITEAPEWLVESLAHKDMQKEKIDPEKVLAGISKGTRDITLFRYACKLRGLGLSRREAEILVTTASQACDPPFDKDVAMRKVAQAWKYPGPEDKKEEIKIWSLDELVNTRFEQPRWIVDGILPEGLSMLVSGPKQGKCAALGTLVSMADGSLVRIEDVRAGDSVQSVSTDGSIVSRKVLASESVGPKEGLTVHTSRGREITVGKEHRLFTCDGWVEAWQLRPGDYVAYPSKSLDIEWCPESPLRAELVGMLIADGGLTTRTPVFTKKDKEIVDRFRYLLSVEFPDIKVTAVTGSKYGHSLTSARGNKNELTSYLRDVGLMGKKSVEKTIPNEFMRASDRVVLSLLSGMYTCDGSVYSGNGKKWVVEYSTGSKAMSAQVRMLLSRFGILTSIQTKTTNFNTTAYTIRVTDQDMCDKLLSIVKIHGEKGRRVGKVFSKFSKISTLPRQLWDRIETLNLDVSSLGAGTIRRGRNLSRKFARAVAERNGDDWIGFLSRAEMSWDRITSIDESQHQEMWDLEVEETHNYIADGLVSHNSLLAARLALEAGSGTHFLGMFRTNKTGVLYLDLEDTPVFAAERWIKINRGARVPSECKTSFRWNRMDDGGLDTLERALDDNPEIGLVVIDILSNFWPADTETGGNTYHKEYAIMNQLGKFADDYGVCCLLVHHDRKVKSGVDMLGGISGTRAMTGAAKTLWILNRDYESTEGKLFITGKHVRERRVNLSFDQETLRWEPTSHLSGET